MSKISVVIPMYFEEKVANECYNRTVEVLNSLIGYDYEIVFVNDGSKDKTLEILEGIAKENSKVKVYNTNGISDGSQQVKYFLDDIRDEE